MPDSNYTGDPRTGERRRQADSAWLAAPLWNRDHVCLAYGGKSLSWLYRGVREKRVPAPIKIGPNSVAWVAEQIRADIESKIAAAQRVA